MPRPGILRSPLLHFLAIGGLLVVARAWLVVPRVELDADRVAEIADGFEARTGRRPLHAELEPLVRAELDEELLYREALARGLDADDPAIEARLVEKLRAVEAEAGTQDARALLARARALGLEREDLVVRRILVEKLLRSATALDPDEAPDAAELERAYRSKREALRPPPTLDLVHVFLSRDRRGKRTEADALALRAGLETSDLALDEALQLGDAFPFGSVLARRDGSELDRIFGAGFARRVETLPPGRWSEPIGSAYGLHLVRVDRREPGSPPRFEAVRERLRLELEAERREAKREALLATLRTRYELAVVWPEEDSR